jgi:hypothetical protein
LLEFPEAVLGMNCNGIGISTATPSEIGGSVCFVGRVKKKSVLLACISAETFVSSARVGMQEKEESITGGRGGGNVLQSGGALAREALEALFAFPEGKENPAEDTAWEALLGAANKGAAGAAGGVT